MTEGQGSLRGRLILGIDLGTTNSGVSVWDAARGEVVMLPDADGNLLLPSVVAWDAPGRRWLVGRAAEDVRARAPARAAYSIKRFLGRRLRDPVVGYAAAGLPYKLVQTSATDPLREAGVDLGDGADSVVLSAPEVSARVLSALRHNAAAALGRPADEVRDAVITVPAYFNDMQRKATRLAGEMAGLNVVGLLNEPTAAALTYADAVLRPEDAWVLVLDLGGGTFDVSLLEASRSAAGYVFATRVVDGDTCLGGDDIDVSLGLWLAAEVERRHGVAPRLDEPAVRAALRRAAEAAKVALSTADATTAELPGLAVIGGATLDARVVVERGRLEECAAEVRRKVVAITRRAVEEVAGLAWRDVAEVILVGGQMLMPAIRRDLAKLAGREPRADDRPQLAVALGAGRYAHNLSRGEEYYHENTLINVLALPLGIRLTDAGDVDRFEPLVPANATLPYVSPPIAVTTTVDNQPSIEVEVFQGPRGATRTDECVPLGSVVMEVLPAPAGGPKFEVTLDVQNDATVWVEVRDTRREPPQRRRLVGRPEVAWREGRPG